MALRFIGLGLAAALGASIAGLAPAAFAQDKEVQFKLSLWVPPAHPLVPSIQAWAADIEKASSGSIKSTVFPSEQLGKAFDHYDMARDGIADFTYVNPDYQPGRFPIVAAGDLPFLIANAKTGSVAFDTWYRAYAASEMKDVHYCLGFVHDPGSFHSHKKILVPADVRGLKVRPAGATVGAFMTSLGATNVQASAPEVRDVLSRGVADAVTFPWGSIVLFGIDKVVNYHMDVPLYVTVFAWVMNKSKYEALSAAQKTVIDDHCSTEWAVKLATPWADFEADGRPKIKAEAGHEVYGLTPEQLAEWRKAAEPMQEKWAENARKSGADPDKVMAELKDALKKQNALY
jgi:TRAP-type C4-dicarboxylate transport system substrate-binding protein